MVLKETTILYCIFFYQLVDKIIFLLVYQNVLQNEIIWFLDLPSQSSPVFN